MLIVKNMTIVANEMSFKNHELLAGDYTAKPLITRKTGKLNNKDNNYGVEMSVIFKDQKDSRFPVDLCVTITGIFDIENGNEKEIRDFLKIQGVQMVYPYLRAMVSNIFTAALLPPVVLPIIDAYKFKEGKEQDILE